MSNKVEMPSHFPFSIDIPIRRIDLSLDVHVSFATILDIVMEAYLAFFAHYKFNVMNVKEKSMIFANANIVYQGELLYKDIVKVDVAPDNFMEKAFDLNFRMTKNNETIPVAFIKIRVLFFDYNIKKVVAVPEEFKSLFVTNVGKQSVIKPNNYSPIWNNAHSLVLKVYRFTKTFPQEEIQNLTIRIRKSATALPMFLIESVAKKDRQELIHIMGKCRGYIEELKYYLILAHDLEYGNANTLIEELESLNTSIKNHFSSILNTK